MGCCHFGPRYDAVQRNTLGQPRSTTMCNARDAKQRSIKVFIIKHKFHLHAKLVFPELHIQRGIPARNSAKFETAKYNDLTVGDGSSIQSGLHIVSPNYVNVEQWGAGSERLRCWNVVVL